MIDSCDREKNPYSYIKDNKEFLQSLEISESKNDSLLYRNDINWVHNRLHLSSEKVGRYGLINRQLGEA